jgi:hypothetical protein
MNHELGPFAAACWTNRTALFFELLPEASRKVPDKSNYPRHGKSSGLAGMSREDADLKEKILKKGKSCLSPPFLSSSRGNSRCHGLVCDNDRKDVARPIELGNPHQARVPTFPQRRRRRAADSDKAQPH